MTQAVRHDSMRARNLEVVLGAVSRGGPLTRAALAELTGLTKSTVSKLVGDLVDAGLLAETGPARAGERGRPGVDVVLSGARIASLGLEINVDYLAVRVLDLTGAVRFAARRDRDNRGSRPKKVLAELQALAGEAITEARRLGLDLAGAVLAVSGPVGSRRAVQRPQPRLAGRPRGRPAAPARPGRAGQRGEPRRARRALVRRRRARLPLRLRRGRHRRGPGRQRRAVQPAPGGWPASWATSS